MNPPSDLSSESKKLWKKVACDGISPGRAEMLAQAFRCLDRLTQVRVELSTAQLTTTTPRTGATHVHPLLKIETELRRQFATLWQTLSLHFMPLIDGFVKSIGEDEIDAEDSDDDV